MTYIELESDAVLDTGRPLAQVPREEVVAWAKKNRTLLHYWHILRPTMKSKNGAAASMYVFALGYVCGQMQMMAQARKLPEAIAKATRSVTLEINRRLEDIKQFRGIE